MTFNQNLFNQKPQASLALHFILDGSYKIQSYDKNRILVFGDNVSDIRTGEDEETPELQLTGERLAIKYQPLATSQALAVSMASAELARARMASRDGFITIPPHCGVELYDVSTIHDPLCSQEAAQFRVMGIKLIYDQHAQQYFQQLLLGAV